jgi:hypothetical protein
MAEAEEAAEPAWQLTERGQTGLACAGAQLLLALVVLLRYGCVLAHVKSVTASHAAFTRARRAALAPEVVPEVGSFESIGWKPVRCRRLKHLLRWELDASSWLCCGGLASHPYDLPQRALVLTTAAAVCLASSWFWYQRAGVAAAELTVGDEARLSFWTVVLVCPPLWALATALAWLRRPALEAVELGYPGLAQLRWLGLPCMPVRSLKTAPLFAQKRVV